MPNITQLPVIDEAGDQVYFLVVDSKIAKRFHLNSLSKQLNAKQIVGVPIAGDSTGNIGEMAFDNNYIYICVATNTWRRMAAGTF
jgi:hypothetical protein